MINLPSIDQILKISPRLKNATNANQSEIALEAQKINLNYAMKGEKKGVKERIEL